MHPEGLAKATALVLDKLSTLHNIEQFYLAGGTACALHLGHRFSHDLDFFSEKTFNHLSMVDDLSKLGNYQSSILEEETILGLLDGVKISFFRYRYSLISKTSPYNGIAVADLRDIAAMKIEAISSRGKKRDFIDLYYILMKGGYRLEATVKLFQKKYHGLDHNLVHIYKSLLYFKDADEDELPQMIIQTDWSEVKRYFRQEVPRVSKKVLGI